MCGCHILAAIAASPHFLNWDRAEGLDATGTCVFRATCFFVSRQVGSAFGTCSLQPQIQWSKRPPPVLLMTGSRKVVSRTNRVVGKGRLDDKKCTLYKQARCRDSCNLPGRLVTRAPYSCSNRDTCPAQRQSATRECPIPAAEQLSSTPAQN